MVTRHRVNLSMSPGDYERLAELAREEGKTPSGFALDHIKALILGGRRTAQKRPKAAQEKPELDRYTMPLPGVEKPAVAPPMRSAQPLSRQQRRELERQAKKQAKKGGR